MVITDLITIGIIALVILLGLYKGFFHTAISTILMVLCVALAFLFMGIGSNFVHQNDELYDMLLSYTEGAEFIDNSELARRDITTVSNAEISSIIEKSGLPTHISAEIMQNIELEAFADEGVVTLGDYFNKTMVNVFINIMSFLVWFILFRVLLSFLLNWADYSLNLPKFTRFDALYAIAMSLIRSMMVLFVVFMICPVLTTMLPFEFVTDAIDGSVFAKLFYESNFLLEWIPGV